MVTIEIIYKFFFFLLMRNSFSKAFSSFWIFFVIAENVGEVGEEGQSFSRFIYKGLGIFVV